MTWCVLSYLIKNSCSQTNFKKFCVDFWMRSANLAPHFIYKLMNRLRNKIKFLNIIFAFIVIINRIIGQNFCLWQCSHTTIMCIQALISFSINCWKITLLFWSMFWKMSSKTKHQWLWNVLNDCESQENILWICEKKSQTFRLNIMMQNTSQCVLKLMIKCF